MRVGLVFQNELGIKFLGSQDMLDRSITHSDRSKTNCSKIFKIWIDPSQSRIDPKQSAMKFSPSGSVHFHTRIDPETSVSQFFNVDRSIKCPDRSRTNWTQYFNPIINSNVPVPRISIFFPNTSFMPQIQFKSFKIDPIRPVKLQIQSSRDVSTISNSHLSSKHPVSLFYRLIFQFSIGMPLISPPNFLQTTGFSRLNNEWKHRLGTKIGTMGLICGLFTRRECLYHFLSTLKTPT